MGLRAYLLRRTIYSLILLFFVITLNFIIFALMPGSPLMAYTAALKIKEPEQAEELMRRWELDKPLHLRYVTYVQNLLTWNFGRSFITRKLVALEITERLQNTILLMGTVSILSITIGVILGVIAASRRGGIFDSATVLSSLTASALPSFWIGMVFLMIFFMYLRWFPPGFTFPHSWMIPGNWPQPLAVVNIPNTPITIRIPGLEEIAGRLRHLFLPTLTLTIFSFGGYLLLTRATVLEALTEDYVVTARAKGLKERAVLFKHVLKNASLPLITSVALTFGFLLTGAIITEQVFSWPGLGMWTWEAISATDYPDLQAIFFIIALCVIVANYIADLLYGIIDPRIKYG